MVKKISKKGNTLSAPSQQLIVGIDNAHNLLSKKRWNEARELLEDINKRFPNHPNVLISLMEVYFELCKMVDYERVCEQLVKLRSQDPDLLLSLAGAYMSNDRPSLALKTFKNYIARWPTHASVEEAHQTAASLEDILQEVLLGTLLSKEEILELTAQLEQMEQYIDRSHLRQAIALGNKLIKRYPRVSAVYNHTSKAFWMEGMGEEAIAASLQVIEFEPDDFDAQCDLVRYYLLTGNKDKALYFLKKLDEFQIINLNQASKYADVLVFHLDFKKIVNLFEQVKQKGWIEYIGSKDVLFLHIAAVIFFRIGNEDLAYKLWNQVLQISPNFILALDNLKDLENEIGNRHAPWIYSLPYWIPMKTLNDLDRYIQPQVRRNDETGIQSASLRFLEKHNEVANLAPIMLEVGDQTSRMFVLRLAHMSKASNLLEAVNMEAANLCCRAGTIPTGMRRYWSKGRWIELLLMGVDVSNKFTRKHEKKVEVLLQSAVEALHKNDGRKAQALLQQAISLDPKTPVLTYNLALAYQIQGRMKESIDLIEQVHDKYPDYLFGRIGLTLINISRGNLVDAHKLLDPLRKAKEMNINEFDAFCDAHIKLYLAEKREDIAKAWYGMWKSMNPGNPKLDGYNSQFLN